jgi:hypothetical protein
MQSLLDSDEEQDDGRRPEISEETKEIVAGLINAFMHKQDLLPGEKTCLDQSISRITADVVGTGRDVYEGIKGVLAIQPNPGMSQRMAPKEASGNIVSACIDGALKVTSLVQMCSTLVKGCVHGDALRMLNATAHHLINMKYLGHRLLVSGVDIAKCLAHSIIAYDRHDYRRFGSDIGTTLRKVLLSDSMGSGGMLPEGVPEDTIIQQTSEGIMRGFFVGGAMLEITDIARPDVDIRLDLHRCIARNHRFFKEIFEAIWNSIAQFSMNAEQHDLQLGQPAVAQGRQPKWTGELMMALMELPSTLQRCNVDEDTEVMLMEAIQTLGQLKFHTSFPRGRLKVKEVMERMARAVQAWTNWDFKEFGKQVGMMLREFLLKFFPLRYSVDAHGYLHRQLKTSRVKPLESFTPFWFVLPVAGGMALTILAGRVTARGMRFPGFLEPIARSSSMVSQTPGMFARTPSIVAHVPLAEKPDVETSRTTSRTTQAE